MVDPNQVIEKFYEYKQRIIVGSLSVMAGMGILIAYSQTGPDPIRYAEAESAFSKWNQSPTDENLYANMKQAIHSAPAIQQKYEASIAQQLLNTDRIEEALVIANRSIEKVREDIPYHVNFAASSLLIEQGEFQQALEDAVALKEQMGPKFLESNRGGSMLYVHNLLRIACLQQALNNRPGEKVAWEELEDLLSKDSALSISLQNNFKAFEVDLTQYISERKKQIDL